MSIVYDFKTVGAAYKKLTPGWLPEAEPRQSIREQIAESAAMSLRRRFALLNDAIYIHRQNKQKEC